MLELRQQQQLHAWEHTPSSSHTSLALLVRASVVFVKLFSVTNLKVERILPNLTLRPHSAFAPCSMEATKSWARASERG